MLDLVFAVLDLLSLTGLFAPSAPVDPRQRSFRAMRLAATGLGFRVDLAGRRLWRERRGEHLEVHALEDGAVVVRALGGPTGPVELELDPDPNAEGGVSGLPLLDAFRRSYVLRTSNPAAAAALLDRSTQRQLLRFKHAPHVATHEGWVELTLEPGELRPRTLKDACRVVSALSRPAPRSGYR